jgi:hypothetical protein
MGEFIAIADADDYAYPQRISRQIKIFQSTADLDVLGSDFTVDPGFHRWEIFRDDVSIRYQLLLNNPMVHSAVMIRKSAIRNSNLYRTEMDTAEDYDLFARMRYVWKFGNYRRKLVHYHISEKNEKSADRQRSLARKIRELVLQDFIPNADDQTILVHHLFSELKPGLLFSDLAGHIEKLGADQKTQDLKKLNKILYTQIFIYCQKFHLKPTIGQRIKVATNASGNWFSKGKRLYNWL